MQVPHVDLGAGNRPVAFRPTAQKLEFLWLELTNRCNLRCVHCYTESSPWTGDDDALTAADYERLMREAFDLGCRKLQLIGGEPQLNRDFLSLLVTAKTIGFEFIEVFTNLTQLTEATIRCAADNGICFATSVYSDTPEGHDAVTQVRSSHTRTVKNLNRLIERGITTRAATIVVDHDQAHAERTRAFLTGLGVGRVRASEVREFGRGETLLSRPAQLDGLCGHCWAGKLCIAPDGTAYPCVMARHWPVGNVLQQSLAEIVAGRQLAGMRQTIFDEVWQPKLAAGRAETHEGLAMACEPNGGPPPIPEDLCEPSTCWPCPQECVPDETSPPCPQACVPFPACAPEDGPCSPDGSSCEPHPQ